MNASRRLRTHLCTIGASLAVAGVMVVAGCTGPTKAGREARAEARGRMSLVNAQIEFDQARRAFEVGQFERAMRLVTTAIERSRNQPEFHLLQGRILLEEHRLEPALASFERSINLLQADGKTPTSQQPLLARAHYFSGIVQQRWSNYQRAYERYQAAADSDDSNVQYPLAAAEALIALERYDDADALMRSVMTRFEHNAALRHLLGQIALLQNDPERAVALLGEARLLNPDDLFLLEELARAQFSAEMFGRCEESLRLLERLSAAEQAKEAGKGENQVVIQRADLLHMKARCLVMTGRTTDARRCYLELTQLTAGQVEPWIEFGAVAFEVGDMRNLATAASRVIALGPDRWEGPFLQALYELRMNATLDVRDDAALERAARLLRQAARRSEQTGDSSPIPHLLLGRVLEQRGDNEGALAAYTQAKRIDPNDRHAHAFIGGISSSMAAVPVE